MKEEKKPPICLKATKPFIKAKELQEESSQEPSKEENQIEMDGNKQLSVKSLKPKTKSIGELKKKTETAIPQEIPDEASGPS